MVWQLLIGFGTGFVDGFLGALSGGFALFNTIASLVLFLPALAVSWRRLHDIDRSGWWIGGFYIVLFVVVFIGAFSYGVAVGISGTDADAGFMTFAVIAGLALIAYAVTMIVFFCTRGTLGPNRYG